MKRRRTVAPEKAPAARAGAVELRGFYSRIPVEDTWEPCATCGTPARILDREHGECIRCRVERARRIRCGFADGPF